ERPASLVFARSSHFRPPLNVRRSDARYDENLFTPSQKLSAEHGNLIHAWKRGEKEKEEATSANSGTLSIA
ncbi:hypothetical protein K0M31_013402, partial [Melipona bicolor]